MKNKPADVKFCGVREESIKNAKPKLNEEVLRYLHLYMTERHNIYKKKEILKLPQNEWTDDEVFKNYRFTNVRRELDRESKWLIENVSLNDKLSIESKILNSMLFRTFNKSKTIEIFGGPFEDWDKVDLDEIKRISAEYKEKHPKYVFFTPAFNTGGLKKANAFRKPPYIRDRENVNVIYPDGKIESVPYNDAKKMIKDNPELDIQDWERDMNVRMFFFVKKKHEEKFPQKLLQSKDQQEVFEHLNSIQGFGGFLAYQIFVDLTYIPEFPFSENEFVVSGPGCSAGLDLLFEDKDGMTDEECLFWVRDNIKEEFKKRGLEYNPEDLFDHLPDYERTLNVMMVENSFCELSKLTKAKRGTGRPRNRYVPTEPAETEWEWE